MSKFKSETMIDGVPERERYERFCGAFVESGNRMYAYRQAFVVDAAKLGKWVDAKARELMTDPDVMRRVQEMRDEAAAKTIVTVHQILQDLVDIANADPNELISVQVDSCRFCYGIEHRYQWIDLREYTEAMDRVLDHNASQGAQPGAKRLPEPDMSGGFGYDPHREPAPTCPSCFGRGHDHVVAHDSRKVSPAARKLYAGAKRGKDGQLEIKMHDQMKAREMIGRTLGAFKDGIPVTPTEAAPRKEAPATAEDAHKAYMRLISGGKAGAAG